MASAPAKYGAVQFEWQLQAACGYAELGMTRESLAELDAIASASRIARKFFSFACIT